MILRRGDIHRQRRDASHGDQRLMDSGRCVPRTHLEDAVAHDRVVGNLTADGSADQTAMTVSGAHSSFRYPVSSPPFSKIKRIFFIFLLLFVFLRKDSSDYLSILAF